MHENSSADDFHGVKSDRERGRQTDFCTCAVLEVEIC